MKIKKGSPAWIMLHQQDYDWVDVSEAREDLLDDHTIHIDGILNESEATKIYLTVNNLLGNIFPDYYYQKEEGVIYLIPRYLRPYDVEDGFWDLRS